MVYSRGMDNETRREVAAIIIIIVCSMLTGAGLTIMAANAYNWF